MSQHILGLARTLPFHSIGGMQSVAWDLLRAFSRKGCRVTVLTTSIPGRSAAFESDGVTVVPIAGTLPERCNASWWSGSRDFAARGLGSRPDVVLSVSAAGAALLPLRRQWAGVPFVFQAHGTSWGELTSKWRSGRPLQWAKSVRNLYWLFKDIGLYKRFDRIVAVGEVIEAQLRRWPHDRLAPGVPVEVIRNGVDTQRFRPDATARAAVREQFGWIGEEQVAVFAARLHPQKGALQAIRAAQHLFALGPQGRLLIIGTGEDEAALRAYVTQQGLSARVSFAGPVPRETMPRLLASGDAFVFPSLRQEGLPVNVLEALACGLTPVCASSLQPVFDPALPIRFADPHDPSAFGKQMAAALTAGRSERSLLAAPYTLDTCTGAYIALFDRLRGA